MRLLFDAKEVVKARGLTRTSAGLMQGIFLRPAFDCASEEWRRMMISARTSAQRIGRVPLYDEQLNRYDVFPISDFIQATPMRLLHCRPPGDMIRQQSPPGQGITLDH